MKVLTIIDSLAVGGAEQSLSMVAPCLIERGVELHVAYLTERTGIEKDLRDAGVIIHSLADSGHRVGQIRAAVALLRNLRPDLVHTTLFEADIVGRIASAITRTPVVSSFVTEAYGPEHLGNPEYRRWKVRAAQLADAVTARFVRRFHAVSNASAAVMSQRLKINPANIDVIARGRDDERLGTPSTTRRAAVRAEIGADPDAKMILAAARHYHFKGLDILVNAMPAIVKTVPDAWLFIAGRDGPSTRDLKAAVRTHEIANHVVFAGYRDDVANLMSAADCFAMPSRAEGSPGSLIEAMALGLPSIASDLGAIRELAGHPPVVGLSRVEDVEAFAAEIISVLTDPDLAATRAKAGRQRYLDNYTMDRIADQMVHFYKTSLAVKAGN